jgi:PleD family two-component response regulator
VVVIDLPGGGGTSGRDLCAALRAASVDERTYIIGTLAPPPDTDRIADLAVAMDRGQISCPDDFLYEPIERATLELRIRAARRTLAVRAALRHEQDELRLLASGLATENRRLQRLAPAEALADLPNRSETIERRD